VLAQAGLVLGYLAFDGEGSLKVDKQEATRYFRLAARAGSKEAEEVLGWVYNTGQYGAI
jgi:TPR repeat protein